LSFVATPEEAATLLKTDGDAARRSPFEMLAAGAMVRWAEMMERTAVERIFMVKGGVCEARRKISGVDACDLLTTPL
jgi:hypothetical protein